ncbi:MAG: LPS assembly protein LptD [Rubritepida sp.]|nr:LPS assembly protein LptD [Rubritepida sp.]
MPRFPARAALLLALLLGAAPAAAQSGLPQFGIGERAAEPAPAAAERPAAAGGPLPIGRVDRDTPVTFTAEEVEFDQATGVVTARGRVEAWQGDRVVRADLFSYDRNTGVALLRGNVQVLEPDGQAFFAEEAELTEGFREGVLRDIRAILVQNARMAAAGARRSEGNVTDLSRVVYSSCNLCESDPSRPPLWQLRARLATQDRALERIFYRDALVEFGGIPLLYAPAFSHPDPQSPRATGFLFPEFGYSRFLGAFGRLPFFWAIDGRQDLTATLTVASETQPGLTLDYRRRFNFGEITAQGSIGFLSADSLDGLSAAQIREAKGFGWHVFSRGRFTIDENWRAGFDVNRASTDAYLRVYRLGVFGVLTSQAFVEGFWGTEAYARVDARAYQGLRQIDRQQLIPIVAPNAIFEHAPRQALLGGRLVWDVGALGITREIGSFSRRLASRIAWERPMNGPVGEVWTVRVQSDFRGYTAGEQQLAPTFLPEANGQRVAANIRAALDWRLPLVRSAGAWGEQLIEPRVQFVTGPATGQQNSFVNEDAIDFEFTDANLFNLSRFTGRDRVEGGSRVDWAMRAQWTFPNGGRIEGLAGASYRFQAQSQFPTNTGLADQQSDWVARARFAPVPWFEVMGRVRLDAQTGQNNLNDAVATLSLGRIGPFSNTFLTAGYLYTPAVPYLLPLQQRNEVSGGAGAQWRSPGGGVWRAAGSFRYSIENQNAPVILGTAGYEDECFIFEARFQRILQQNVTGTQNFLGGTVLLFRIGLKTVGDLALRAI